MRHIPALVLTVAAVVLLALGVARWAEADPALPPRPIPTPSPVPPPTPTPTPALGSPSYSGAGLLVDTSQRQSPLVETVAVLALASAIVWFGAVMGGRNGPYPRGSGNPSIRVLAQGEDNAMGR
jgi:hypothetical protein